MTIKIQSVPRFDSHDAVDALVKSDVSRIRFASWENRMPGQRIVISHNHNTGKIYQGVSSNYLIYREGNGFLSAIQEVIPPNPGILNPSEIQCDWTLDPTKALQFSESESARILQCNGVGVVALEMRLAWCHGQPWKPGDALQFPVQKALDKLNRIQIQDPFTA